MKTTHKLVIAALIEIVVLTIAAVYTAPRQATVQVHVHGAGGTLEVQATIYSANYCTWCIKYIKAIKAEMPKDGWLIRDATDKDAGTAHVLIQKDADELQRQGIDRIPCTVFRKNGKEVKRTYGELTPDQLADTINSLAKGI